MMERTQKQEEAMANDEGLVSEGSADGAHRSLLDTISVIYLWKYDIPCVPLILRTAPGEAYPDRWGNKRPR